jgi:hypothetical protein
MFMADPLGLTEATPRFHFGVNSSKRGTREQLVGVPVEVQLAKLVKIQNPPDRGIIGKRLFYRSNIDPEMNSVATLINCLFSNLREERPDLQQRRAGASQ